MIFEKYPKIRFELPPEYKAVYEEQYIRNRNGQYAAASASQKVEEWLHRKVAKDVVNDDSKRTLEIGAGTLNQLKHEPSKDYDIVEPFTSLFENSPHLHRIANVYNDISEIDMHQKYDRITSVATFEHILNLPEVVAKSCLLLNKGGSLRTSIPNEGTWLWSIGWKATTGFAYRRKYGLDYGIMMKHEHCNNADEVEEILKYFYNKSKMSVFGLNKAFALYRFYESSEPNISRAEDYLNSLKK